MAMNLESMGLSKLTVQERLDLIESLWESLPDQIDASTIPDWHIAELSKRRAAANANPGQGKPWRQVLTSLTY
jgi:putative addiction module component (TIGR02574 family)